VRNTGIIIPDFIKQQQQNVPRFGEIVACGPGDPNRNGGQMTVKVGDHVSFFFHSGTPFEFAGVTHLLMREFDITMIVNDFTQKEVLNGNK
jgi:co-chaperonin GroES (HSP10)